MNQNAYIDNIKLELTGGILELELTDEALVKVLNKVLLEVQRYIDETRFMTIPYARCIDLKDSNVSSVSRVYRTQGYTGDTSEGMQQSNTDPMYAQMWMAFSNGGTMYNLNDYVLNYMSYNTLLQMRNTTSTDMAFLQDKSENKLYINTGFDNPTSITIEYIPLFKSVEEVTSDYWIEIIQRMAIAQTKCILGKIRGRYKQSNALWTQDAEEMTAEGSKELETLRETLRVNSQMLYPID
jgi:hypothetical protein